jgi:predicted HTH transcriptional regulator
MTVAIDTTRAAPRPTPTEVLETFGPYQPKTARMVAEAFRIDERTAARLLDVLVRRGALAKARASTETPVWLRASVE